MRVCLWLPRCAGGVASAVVRPLGCAPPSFLCLLCWKKALASSRRLRPARFFLCVAPLERKKKIDRRRGRPIWAAGMTASLSRPAISGRRASRPLVDQKKGKKGKTQKGEGWGEAPAKTLALWRVRSCPAACLLCLALLFLKKIFSPASLFLFFPLGLFEGRGGGGYWSTKEDARRDQEQRPARDRAPSCSFAMPAR
nr:hypothetical protein [Pandoravirus massiliensis]